MWLFPNGKFHSNLAFLFLQYFSLNFDRLNFAIWTGSVSAVPSLVNRPTFKAYRPTFGVKEYEFGVKGH